MSRKELSQLLVVLLSTLVFPKGREKGECTGAGSISKWEVKEIQGMERSQMHKGVLGTE